MQQSAPLDEVGTASNESFPASDPPAWTLGSDIRIEQDSMGAVHVPRGVLYGPQTQRAVENFPIGQHRLQPKLIQALALIKSCAAMANGALHQLPEDRAEAIAKAADEIADGGRQEEFVVNVFQTGSGTSTNMNMNEVIATLTQLHPNDDVNHGQSSNDVFPSAIHIAAVREVAEKLLPAMQQLCTSLEAKEVEFHDVFKIGRTHLQDATPMRLGQEFGGYGHQVRLAMDRVSKAMEGLYELPLGGTAVGTGVNAPPGFAIRTIRLIAQRARQPFREAQNHFEAQAAKDAVLYLSGALRSYAVALSKIANDIRWLSSGPRAGLAEIELPAVQPGSSIMPGKINPVIAESALMVCAQVIGHDAAIAWGCASGNFELNTMMPLIAYDLLDSIDILAAASHNFAARCVAGIRVARHSERTIDRSLAMATMLVPAIGYDKAAELAKEAFDTGETVREVAMRKTDLGRDKINELLSLPR